MTWWECYENKWFYMKYIGKYLQQWLAAGLSFSPGTSVSTTNKTDRHNIFEILVKVALNTIALTLL